MFFQKSCRKLWPVLFVQVCELDIIFNFEKAYFILDEFLMGGEIQDTSKKSVLKAIEQADLLQEVTWALPPLPRRVRHRVLSFFKWLGCHKNWTYFH